MKVLEGCLFCAIVEKSIASEIVFEDEDILAFKDVDPKAPIHILLIPKKHIESVATLGYEDRLLVGKIFTKIRDIASELNLSDGYRVVTNIGTDGGQSVKHLHFHLMGKRKFSWPPG